jgi:hypothetical protein
LVSHFEGEHGLRVFENRVLRKIFGPTREEDGPWRKLHNDEFHILYSSPNTVRVIESRKMSWAERVARMGRVEVFTGFLFGRPDNKRPLGRLGCRWEDKIKLYLREIGSMERTGFSWLRIGQMAGFS